MTTLNYLLLAARDPQKSAETYTKILGGPPVENSPGFVLYVLDNGIKIGLWKTDEIEPKAKPAGGIEVSFSAAARPGRTAAAGARHCPRRRR